MDVAAISSLGTMAIHPGNGDGTFDALQSVTVPGGMATNVRMVAGDVSGDGRPDVVMALRGSDSVYVLLNTTMPPAPAPPPTPPPPTPPLPAIVVGIPKTVKVQPNGTVTLGTATNPPTVKTVQTLSRKTNARAARVRFVVIGRGRTVILPGGTKKVTAKLTLAGRKLVRRGPVKARLRIVATGLDGKTATITRTITLRASVRREPAA